MAEFYGREGSFQDFYLELPTKQVVDRDLGEAKLQVEAMKENALIQKGYDKDYLDALSKKYKVQNKNLAANRKLKEANYQLIFEAHQENSQREFEAIQKAQGNIGPKDATALGELVKFAPKLVEMIGNYKQKEWDWKVAEHTNFISSTGIRKSDLSRWQENRELILSNSLEAQQFIKAESERLGVQLTPKKMLEVMNVTGELALIQQEALNHNAVSDYGVYLSGNGNAQIVLSDGTETTWAAMQSPDNSGDRYLEALRFMKGKFLQENDIDILTVPIGPLGSLTERMLKVEDSHNGRFSRAKSQQTAIQHKNAIDTQIFNSAYEGDGFSYIGIVQRNANKNLDENGKPNFTDAHIKANAVLLKGINAGTISSEKIEAIRKAYISQRGDGGRVALMYGNTVDAARARESDVTFQNERNYKARSLETYYQLEKMFLEDWDGQNRMAPEQLDAYLKGLHLTPEHRKKLTAQFTSGTSVYDGTSDGSNSKDEVAKGIYDNMLQTTVDTIGQQIVGGDNSSMIDHAEIIGWGNVENDITTMYREYYNRKWAATIGSTHEKAEAAARYARDEVITHYRDNPGLTAISADTKKNSKGEEVKLTDEERTFKRYSFGSKGRSNNNSEKLARLGDTTGVSPTDRVLSMSKPEDGILDKSDVDRYVDSDGNISLRSFRANPLVREIVKQTRVPASDIYQRHAELYGLPTLSDKDHFTYEELQQSTKPIQRMMEYNSPSSEIVGQAAINPGAREVPSYLKTSYNVAGLNGTTPNYDNRSFTYVPEHRALLDLISFAEGTYDQPHSGYGTKVGFSKFDFMRGHDRVIPSGQISDASGRYQFLSTTWGTTGNANRPMTPEAQDWAATRLVLRRLNLPQNASGLKVLMNKLNTEGITEEFIDALAPEWASMPNLIGADRDGRVGTRSSYYGQGGKSYEELTEFYSRVLDSYNKSRGVQV